MRTRATTSEHLSRLAGSIVLRQRVDPHNLNPQPLPGEREVEPGAALVARAHGALDDLIALDFVTVGQNQTPARAV